MKLAKKRKRENSNIVDVHWFRPDPSSNPLLLLFNSISDSFEGKKKSIKAETKKVFGTADAVFHYHFSYF